MLIWQTLPLLMDWEVATGLEYGDISAGKRFACERVHTAALNLIRHLCGCLVSSESCERRFIVYPTGCILILIHMGEVRVRSRV